MVTSSEPRNQSRVLVIGMSAGMKRAGRRSQALKELNQSRRPSAVFGTDLGLRAGLPRNKTDQQSDDDDKRISSSVHTTSLEKMQIRRT